MKLLVLFAAIWLAACSGDGGTNTISEADLSNQADALTSGTDARVNAMIAQIEKDTAADVARIEADAVEPAAPENGN